MIVIRRMIDRRSAYTAIFLPGEPPRIFPTTDQEHVRVLEIFKQDRAYDGIHNDFSEYGIGLAVVGGGAVTGKGKRQSKETKSPSRVATG